MPSSFVMKRAFGFTCAVVLLAACSGTQSQSQLPSFLSQGALGALGRPVPVAPPARNSAGQHASSGRYPTQNSLVFDVDSDANQLHIYQTRDLPSNAPPIAYINLPHECGYGIANDDEGTVYVAEACASPSPSSAPAASGSFTGDIVEYAKGSTTLKTTITDGIDGPYGVAVDKNQTLYVSNSLAATITEYAHGTTKVSKTVTGGGMTAPVGLCTDTGGNLYIADYQSEAVFELPAGGSTVENLGLTDLHGPINLACDQKHGYLWVVNAAASNTTVYKLGSTTPFETIPGNEDPYAISIQNRGKQFKGTVVISDIRTYSIYAYKKNTYTPYATLKYHVELPTGLLITKL